ncbi:CGNR zinc finger [Streptomyces sp. S4.7]|uniref:CGNR zinc finger domain-containing protein n=1 Tax=Streptomyces sp. S4.7 TaxID=2705439 RepID=UPI001397AA73|nr:CGNR zinc finger domain-containing protein [Streptomyces sp. S4.7]QHZ00226.1 CGNR zinc finger [Streptomyces sp. S4.7]
MESTEPGTSEGPLPTAAPLLGEPLPVEFMNTVWADRDGVHDELARPGGLAAWLRGVGPRLPQADGPSLARLPEPSADDLRRFRRLRDALRRLAAVTTGDTADTRGRGPGGSSEVASDADAVLAAVDAVNESCAYTPSWSMLEWTGENGPTRTAATEGTSSGWILSQLAEEGVRLFAGPGRTELRACHGPRCVLYFVRSHPRREWCSADCGNRARVARHYRRHRDAAQSAQA